MVKHKFREGFEVSIKRAITLLLFAMMFLKSSHYLKKKKLAQKRDERKLDNLSSPITLFHKT